MSARSRKRPNPVSSHRRLAAVSEPLRALDTLRSGLSRLSEYRGQHLNSFYQHDKAIGTGALDLTFPLPSMHLSRPSHPTHDLVEDQEDAILVAYFSNAFEISRDRCEVSSRSTHDYIGISYPNWRVYGSDPLVSATKAATFPSPTRRISSSNSFANR